MRGRLGVSRPEVTSGRRGEEGDSWEITGQLPAPVWQPAQRYSACIDWTSARGYARDGGTQKAAIPALLKLPLHMGWTKNYKINHLGKGTFKGDEYCGEK